MIGWGYGWGMFYSRLRGDKGARAVESGEFSQETVGSVIYNSEEVIPKVCDNGISLVIYICWPKPIV
jgi:hypothetical protein